MTGIEILSQMNVATEFTCNWWLATTVWVALIIFGTAIGFCGAEDDKTEWLVFGMIIGAIFGFFMFGITLSVTEKPTVYETQYKVTIDSSVPMTEFYEHYEVIDQEGKIFTVRERTK